MKIDFPRIFALAVAFFLSANFSFAQLTFTRVDTSIRVIVSGQPLKNPWAGGINWAEFSPIDMNGDGIKDLFVFDKSGNKIITFINGGSPDSVDYKHEFFSYKDKFPQTLTGWTLLTDYDCDGKPDIFTASSSSSIAVYHNDYNVTNGLSFSLVTNSLQADIDGSPGNIVVGSTNLPAFIDTDDDGDLDIITFGTPTCVWYYKNLSMETFGVCDSLLFTRANRCWGHFVEDLGTCSAILSVDCNTFCGGSIPPPNNYDGAGRNHNGGFTVLALDLDGNNLKDLIIGDDFCSQLYMVHNNGTFADATIDNTVKPYPSANPVNLNFWVAAFYADMNNDGKRDLLAAPNAANASANINSVWYYENTGTDASPVFSFRQEDLLQNQMIDVGGGANPAFLDYNADGLLDLVIGNDFWYGNSFNNNSTLSLYENIGTATNPQFQFVTNDFTNLSSYNLQGIYPSFGDLDNDGDIDMMIGEYDGILHYFQNMAGAGSPVSYPFITVNYKGIDVGLQSAPQLIDVDGDSLLDLVIGERNGNLNYYRNTGTKTSPDFSGIATNTFFGCVDVRKPTFVTGYSSPFMSKLDSTGKFQLVAGSETGYLHLYNNIEGNLSGCFAHVDSMFLGTWEGPRTSVSGADINNDGKIDLAVGNYGGGVTIYINGGGIVPISNNEILQPKPEIKIFPNPFSESATIRITSASGGTNYEFRMYDLLGQEIKSETIPNSETFVIRRDNLPSGMYFYKVTQGDAYLSRQSRDGMTGKIIATGKLIILR